MEANKILSISNLNIYQTLIFMYKHSNSQIPVNFNTFFKKRTHSKYNLRSNKTNSRDLILPLNSCKYIEHGLYYRGPKFWNAISDDLKLTKDLRTFKKHLKAILVIS